MIQSGWGSPRLASDSPPLTGVSVPGVLRRCGRSHPPSFSRAHRKCHPTLRVESAINLQPAATPGLQASRELGLRRLQGASICWPVCVTLGDPRLCHLARLHCPRSIRGRVMPTSDAHRDHGRLVCSLCGEELSLPLSLLLRLPHARLGWAPGGGCSETICPAGHRRS